MRDSQSHTLLTEGQQPPQRVGLHYNKIIELAAVHPQSILEWQRVQQLEMRE